VVLDSAWKRLLVVAACALGVLALPTIASADVEPNNGITEAEGPLAGGVTYTGAVANSTDLDTYFFYVNGQQQIDVKVTDTSGSCMGASFGDKDNENLNRYIYFNEGQTQDFTYTTPPGVNRFYLELNSKCPIETRYSFVIAPAAGIVGGPANLVPAPTVEPNENSEQASGPLLGGIAYTGEIQTVNDEDWFKLYTAPGAQQFDVAFTSTGECSPEVELKGPGEHDDFSNYASSDEWEHFTETSPAAGVYYLRFYRGCVGSWYEFVVNPPGALTLSPPPPSVPAPTPSPTPAPAKVHRGYAIANPSAKVEKGNALLELTCAGAGDCAGTVSLVARANGDADAKVVVGSGTFALARGTSTTLPVALSRLGMGMLHLAPNGQVHVHLSGHDLKGGSLLLTATEGHKRKRHRHHHRRHHRHRHR
jgi:hypothetical protein